MVSIKAFLQRGELIESVHEAKCLVKNSKYENILSTNHNQNFIYPRSSIKIFQAVPFIISGAHKIFSLNNKCLAIACASHCGEKQHVKTLKDWLYQTNISLKHLKCGIHNPINLKASNNLFLSGNLPSQLHNNCAGKHLAMISGCKANRMQYNDYINFNHPYQKLIRSSLEYFTGSTIQKKCIGIDGCSAPQYAFSYNSLAKSMVNIFKKNHKKNEYIEAINVLLCSIKKYPELIGGKNRFDSEIIKYTKGRIFCKGGAEGVFLFSEASKKIGGVIKVIDGNERAIPSIAIKIFQELKILNGKETMLLKKWREQKIFNHAKKQTGSIHVKINK